MTNFVLVHGAWGGGSSYDRLARELRERGHTVLVAQLAGLGTRRDGLNPAIDLSTHVRDVIGQVEAAGIDRFVLCGHSYGGMVITGVATRLGARIDALCYIDAFLPGDGQSLWDITGDYEHRWYVDTQKDTPGLVAPIGGVELLKNPRYGRHPLLTLLEPVRFTGEEAKVPRRTYIFATGWQPSPFPRFRDAVNGDPAWQLHEVGGGHDVMADQGERLLEIVLDLA
ncbi:alpha/beta fold hydrolase [Novosphingobium sp.]|uniref:alpha/beta fold hydrolase n=1 Tax=Novosphingobium sp. TaxID=1874826 RepID=UPI0035B24D00